MTLPALLALVTEWQETQRAVSARPHPDAVRFQIAAALAASQEADQ